MKRSYNCVETELELKCFKHREKEYLHFSAFSVAATVPEADSRGLF